MKYFNKRHKLETQITRLLKFAHLYREFIMMELEAIKKYSHEISRFHVEGYENVKKLADCIKRLDHYHQKYNRIDALIGNLVYELRDIFNDKGN